MALVRGHYKSHHHIKPLSTHCFARGTPLPSPHLPSFSPLSEDEHPCPNIDHVLEVALGLLERQVPDEPLDGIKDVGPLGEDLVRGRPGWRMRSVSKGEGTSAGRQNRTYVSEKEERPSHLEGRRLEDE